jgi:PKD domain
LLKVGAVCWGFLVVAVAVALACGALAPAAYASLGVPTTGSVPFTAPSASYPTVSSAMSAFEAGAGGGDNGTAAGEQGSGYRHATWDQIALDGTDPGSTTIESGHVIVPARSRLESWGLALGPQIAVSGDGFHSVNSTPFTPFSPPNAWGAFNGTTAELDVVAPAGQGSTPTPAQTRGLGIVFLNPTGASPAQIEYYNVDIPLFQLSAPAGTTSFAGVLFPDPVVTRVVVTLGSSEMFGWDGTAVTAGVSGSVAGDDVALAEPGPKLQATAGIPISPVLDTFTENDPSAYDSAAIDWGDGTQTAGTIVPAPGGEFNVVGSHSYAQAGTYTAKVTVNDSDGAEQTSDALVQVAPRASSLSVTCSPSPVAVTASTTCTATVADAGGGGPITPTGTVELSSPTAGASFADDSGCILGPSETPGLAICEVQFTPTQLPPAQARIDGFYPGDGAHSGSSEGAVIGVRAQRCTLRALSAKLKGRAPLLGMVVTCDARANVTIAVKATGARKGSFRAFTLAFGTLKAAVTAGRPTVLTIRPSQGALGALRTAGRRHQRVSLRLTLTASSHATRTTTTTRVGALRVR